MNDWMHPDLRDAIAATRRLLTLSDNNGHAAREFVFDQWCADTVFPAAVNWLVEEIGGLPCSRP